MKKINKILLLTTLILSTSLQGAITCSSSVSNVGFGTYDILSVSDSTTFNIITVSCSRSQWWDNKKVKAKITLSDGNSNDFNNRYMSNGTDNLNYNLYKKNNYATVFGGNKKKRVKFKLNNVGQTYTKNRKIFGKLNAGQNVSSGFYSDTIIVSISY